jgi:FlaA1/EpsC-like NDP-sugar epimerase
MNAAAAAHDDDGSQWVRFSDWALRRRFALAGAADLSIVALAVVVASAMRYEFDVSRVLWGRTAAFIAMAVGIHLALGMLEGLYMGAARFGSFDELAGLTRAVVFGTVAAAMFNYWVLNHLVPVSVSLGYGIGALVMMSGERYLWRLELERRRRPDIEQTVKVVVYGAGEGGHQIITAMLRNPDSRYYPVALVDDDPAKAQLRISNVRVEGPLSALCRVAEKAGAEAVVIAVPSAVPELVRRASDVASDCGLQVLILPPVEDLLDGAPRVSDIRPVTEEDLLGRGHVDTDVAAIAGYLTGKRVLVTGAGGSIGSELCRQIHRFGPEELIMLDRDESLLHAVQLSIDGRGQLDTRALVVADIRDHERIAEIFDEWKPHVVFHAAALKHVPLLEMHPEEGYKTNVLGTQHLLDCAADFDVERFVNISTDKAADPVNVLGRTKREAELRTAAKAAETAGTFISVRFGNVLGSRGSVLCAFREQIAAGGPVTVTHPEVTRYFMTITESVELVIQAGAIGRDGEVLILDMGEPVKIADVAQRMVDADERDIDIVFTGLREGEKMHEVLLSENEAGQPGPHPLITHVAVGDVLELGGDFRGGGTSNVLDR